MLQDSIQFYNKTKFEVDMTDQVARKYTVKSSSRRWLLQIFFNILDLAKTIFVLITRTAFHRLQSCKAEKVIRK